VNESDSIDVIFTKRQIEGNARNQVFYDPKNYPQNTYHDLYDILKYYVGSDDPSRVHPLQDGSFLNTFPMKNVFIPVDKATVLQNGTVDAADSVLDSLRFTISKSWLGKNDLIEYAIIAANKWKRPIYFSMNHGTGLDLEQYLREDGLVYRLVPVVPKTTSNTGDTLFDKYSVGLGRLLSQNVHGDWMYKLLMNKFVFGGANIPGVYFDEENRRHLISIREAYADAAIEMVREGKREQAQQLLEHADKSMLEENFPYAMPSKFASHNQTTFKFLFAAYVAKDQNLIDKVSRRLRKELKEEMTYYNSLSPDQMGNYAYEQMQDKQMLTVMDQFAKDFAPAQNTGEPGSTLQLGIKADSSGKK